MKKILLIVFTLPMLVTAQTKANPHTPIKKTVAAPAAGFVINGEITGFADGTTVALLNGQTSVPEIETTITKNKFSFKGKLAAPDFKAVLFNKKPPYIFLFLDNSTVKITGTKDAIETAVVTGSPSHKDFVDFNKTIFPYQSLFAENAVGDPAATTQALGVIDSFIQEHPASYIAPLAIIRYNQLSGDVSKMETMYNGLNNNLKTTAMGNYIAQQIAEGKKNAIGTVLADFSQPDTTGQPISLSSLRGKYVLVDFWASWCRPCRQENPNVVANYNKYKNKNFTILGVSLDEDRIAWIKAIKKDKLTWQHVSDLKGWSNAAVSKYGFDAIPYNVLLDPQGKIIATELREGDLGRKLAEVLK